MKVVDCCDWGFENVRGFVIIPRFKICKKGGI